LIVILFEDAMGQLQQVEKIKMKARIALCMHVLEYHLFQGNLKILSLKGDELCNSRCTMIFISYLFFYILQHEGIPKMYCDLEHCLFLQPQLDFFLP
jgi:hypothetical protein